LIETQESARIRGVMSARARAIACGVVLGLCAPRVAFAQRELHWARLDVGARLDAAGALQVTETHRMVFTGDWNGGERTFNIRTHQKLSFTRISREDAGGPRELHENRALSNIDDYAWIDRRTLRWRSRLQSDPLFANTAITYVLRYQLSGILRKTDDRYLLDHDFAFPDRAGAIDAFGLRLALDPAWQPQSESHPVYTAFGLAPGQHFVLTIPLRYTGRGEPVTREGLSPRVIAIAISILLGVTTLGVVAFFMREQSYGRFAPLVTEQIDDTWIAEHIVKHPAEVVGAAWDESIGTPEVVALIARMVSEGTLESDVAHTDSRTTSMTLRLKVDRSGFEGYERTLLEALFFDGRTQTSTEDVKAHYSDRGFDPVAAIREELQTRVRSLWDEESAPPLFGKTLLLLFVSCAGLLWFIWYTGDVTTSVALLVGVGALVVAAIARIAGLTFRGRMDWGRRAAVACLVPALSVAIATAAFLWFYVANGSVDLPLLMLIVCIALPLWITYTSIRGLKSRPNPAAIAFRKKLTAARMFFESQLAQPHPALRDEWYPWVLAFGLGEQADAWSTAREPQQEEEREPRRPREDRSSTYASSSSSSSPPTWSGFGGGRSGGAGGGAAWSVAAAGMVAPVAAPKSTDSDSSSSGGSSISSSSGSSGGGGGGGW
jgi:hypothetical protein